MAATDQNYRNQTTLNLVFAVSCVLMLLSIVWMLWDDYSREFKTVQREFRNVEAQLSLVQMLDNMPNAKALEKAKDRVADAHKALDAERKTLTEQNKDLIARRDKAEAEYQKWKALFDSRSSYRDQDADAVSKAKTDSERAAAQQRLDARTQEVKDLREKTDEAQREFAEARRAVDSAIEAPLKGLQQKLTNAEDDLKKLSGAFDRFAKLAAEKRWKASDTFRNLPIIDGFASPTRINQIVLRDLPIDYGGFMDVTRYDRCATCHMAIDRATFDRKTLFALGDEDRVRDLQDKLDTARGVLLDRVNGGEKLGFDPTDLPKKLRALDLTDGQVVQFAAHPRLDLFVDGNSTHPMEKFGCTICHGGQGSATSFTLASHTPNDTTQKKLWEGSDKEGHDWHAIHDWDFPMLPKRFVESGCVKCHHEMTDLVRFGSKEEAPKLLRGYNLVRDNGCYGCHEIAGMKRGRPVGPDLRLEPTPPLEWLPPREQVAANADPQNPPGTLRKVGPGLRRLADKIGGPDTKHEWLLSWIKNPRGFRPDTRMPHFYGLSNNHKDALPEDQKKFPDAEIQSIAYYLLSESDYFLGGEDTTRAAVRKQIEDLHKKLKRFADLQSRGQLGNKEKAELDRLSRSFVKDRKDLDKLTVRWRDLSLMSLPSNAKVINDQAEALQGLHERIYDIQTMFDKLRTLKKDADERDKLLKDIEEGRKVFGELQGAMSRAIAASKPLPPVAKAENLVAENGQPFSATTVPEGNEESGARGKQLFTEKGCLACHSHQNVAIKHQNDEDEKSTVLSSANYGPELSRLAIKLRPGKEGRLWLIQWVLNPNVHSPRTRMPITHLDVKEAAAIADWLLSQKDPGWKPDKVAAPASKVLRQLAETNLAKSPAIGKESAREVLDKGIPKAKRDLLDPDSDEQLLVDKDGKAGPIDDQRLMRYVGKKAISRLGCFGCHDIPGFEAAKPIGTQLNDWGRKDPERIAFEDASAFVKDHFTVPETRDDEDNPDKPSAEWKEGGKEPLYEEYFAESLHHHQREGFLHLKLLEPRSYDFNRERSWEDRLRMPQFRFARTHQRANEKDGKAGLERYKKRRNQESKKDYDNLAQFEEARAREAVMTFVLGLVADPVPLKFVYSPKPARLAEARGRQVLDKYNCAGCHELRPGTYEFKVPDKGAARDKFLTSLEAGLNDPKDHVFPESNAWVGRPSPISGHLLAFAVAPPPPPRATYSVDYKKDKAGARYEVRLSEALRFTDRQGAVRDRPAGELISIPAPFVVQKSATYGGDFARLVGPVLGGPELHESKFSDYTKQRTGLPPPLVREGERTQPSWLYKFIRDPFKMRPYTVLRMPKFNMSADEARTLVEYFGAVDKTENPGMGLTEPFLTVGQQDEKFWLRESSDYVAMLADKKGPDASERKRHLAEAQGELEVVWQRTLAGRVASKERDLEGADAAVEAARAAEKKAKQNLKDAKAADKAKAEEAVKTAQSGRETAEKKYADVKKERDGIEKESKAIREYLKKPGKEPFSSKEYGSFVKEWRESQAYASDAYRLVTASGSCMTCHSAGEAKSSNEQGPDLALAFERLRPRWTGQWIANPNRLMTYPPHMPANFPNDQKPDQSMFYGTQRQHALAARDLLMNLPAIANLPVNRYRLAPRGGK